MKPTSFASEVAGQISGGRMFFVETGIDKMNVLIGNLGAGAIPPYSGMIEKDQEPTGFGTAAPHNLWRDNAVATGSVGWYFRFRST